jgi:hypothetical protein
MNARIKLLKEGKSHTEMSDGSVLTPKFRVSYPHLTKATPGPNGGKEKYSLSMIFDEKSVDLTNLKALAKKAMVDKFGKDYKKPSNFKSPFRNGDERPNDPAYEGKVFINASTEIRPVVVDQKRREITSTQVGDEDAIYAGCYGIAQLSAYAYGGAGTTYAPGVAFGLRMVQKVADGGPLGAAQSDPNDVFDVLDDDEDDADNYAADSSSTGDEDDF